MIDEDSKFTMAPVLRGLGTLKEREEGTIVPCAEFWRLRGTPSSSVGTNARPDGPDSLGKAAMASMTRSGVGRGPGCKHFPHRADVYLRSATQMVGWPVLRRSVDVGQRFARTIGLVRYDDLSRSNEWGH